MGDPNLQLAETYTVQVVRGDRRTGTRHPISPSEAVRLKAQGVAPEVLDALNEAHTRWAQDEAAAVRARRDAEQAAALTRPVQTVAEQTRQTVAALIAEVRAGGDAAAL